MPAKRGTRWGQLRGEFVEVRELARLLRNTADEAGMSLRALEQLIPYGRTAISERMSGAVRPEWEFVEKLAAACAGRDKLGERLLLDKLKPAWEASDLRRARRINGVVPVKGTPTEIVSALGETASLQRLAAEVQASLGTNTGYLAGLSTALTVLGDQMVRLTAERDELQRTVARHSALHEELDRVRAELAETQRRLEETEDARLKMEQLLNEAWRQREEVERLREETQLRLDEAMRRLDDLGDGRLDSPGPPLWEEEGEEVRLLDDRTVSDVAALIQRVDSGLRAEAEHLERLESDVMSSGRPADSAVTSADERWPIGRTPAVWGRVPPRNTRFTGRDGLLEELGERLGETGLVVLNGVGGIGKTQIAIEFAHRFKGRYDLVWWIPADQPVLVRSSLAAIAPQLGVPPASMSGVEDAANAVLDALRRGEPYERWLLIYDNADAPEDLLFFLPQWPGHTLITSRNHRWSAVTDLVDVSVFDRAESVGFLRRRLPRGLEDREAIEFTRQLGGHPLALEQAAALFGESGMGVEEFVSLLISRTAQVLSEGKPTEYPLSFSAMHHLALSRLKEKLPEAAKFLYVCAFFGASAIPREVFKDRLGLPEELGRILGDPLRLARVWSELVLYGLASHDVEEKTLRFHPLTQALVREELDLEEQQRYGHIVHLLLARSLPSDPAATVPPQILRLLMEHLEPTDIASCQTQEVREFAFVLVSRLYGAEDLTRADHAARLFLSSWLSQNGNEEEDVARMRDTRTVVLRELERPAEITAPADRIQESG